VGLESEVVFYALYMQLCAAVFHLAAPGRFGDTPDDLGFEI
jgi:hypothetical protein